MSACVTADTPLPRARAWRRTAGDGKRPGRTRAQTTARDAYLARETAKASAARIGDSIDNDLVAAP